MIDSMDKMCTAVCARYWWGSHSWWGPCTRLGLLDPNTSPIWTWPPRPCCHQPYRSNRQLFALILSGKGTLKLKDIIHLRSIGFTYKYLANLPHKVQSTDDAGVSEIKLAHPRIQPGWYCLGDAGGHDVEAVYDIMVDILNQPAIAHHSGFQISFVEDTISYQCAVDSVKAFYSGVGLNDAFARNVRPRTQRQRSHVYASNGSSSSSSYNPAFSFTSMLANEENEYLSKTRK